MSQVLTTDKHCHKTTARNQLDVSGSKQFALGLLLASGLWVEMQSAPIIDLARVNCVVQLPTAPTIVRLIP